jgi:AmmeMemoRadiSam system protein A
MLVYGLISPHPPVIIPDIGKDELKHVRKTVAAMKLAAVELAQARPDEIIIIAPHEGHGFEVPKYYLQELLPGETPVHEILATEPSYDYYYEFGKQVGAQVAVAPRRYAIVASGDLSHVLKPDGPYGYDASGPKLDELIVRAVRNNNPQALLEIDSEVLEDGAECGLRSVLFLMGALEGTRLEPEVLSYEGPFGVGYLVASYEPHSPRTEVAKGPAITELARLAIEEFLEVGKVIRPPEDLPAGLMRKGAAFVSLHDPDGQLRGCIGTTTATKQTLAQEVITNAIAAATGDPRFEPLALGELEGLRISVDILGRAYEVKDKTKLDPKKYGIIITGARGRSGVLLPDIEGVDTVEEQIAICRGKAGIGPSQRIKIRKFQVDRFSEMPAAART